MTQRDPLGYLGRGQPGKEEAEAKRLERRWPQCSKGKEGSLREAGQAGWAAGSLSRDTQGQNNGTGPPRLGWVLRAEGRIEENGHYSPYPPTRVVADATG